MKTFLREILGTIALAVIIFLVLHTIFPSFIVEGPSMEDSLHHEQRLLVNRAIYYFHEPEKGDVIIFRPPNNPDPKVKYIKRIIGLPGESVGIKEGVVYTNGEPLDEPYITRDFPNDTLAQTLIPDGEYFVLGDNRPASGDSRNGWTVKREDIIGKAWLLIGLPKGEWGLAPNYSY